MSLSGTCNLMHLELSLFSEGIAIGVLLPHHYPLFLLSSISFSVILFFRGGGLRSAAGGIQQTTWF